MGEKETEDDLFKTPKPRDNPKRKLGASPNGGENETDSDVSRPSSKKSSRDNTPLSAGITKSGGVGADPDVIVMKTPENATRSNVAANPSTLSGGFLAKLQQFAFVD